MMTLRSLRQAHVLSVALLAACIEPGCGSSGGSSAHDASAGERDGTTTGMDGGTECSSAGDASHSTDSSGQDASNKDASSGDGGSGEAQKPGPSAQLFMNPYYQCLRNYYVSTTGKDSNDGMTSATAWATIANADTSDRKGGDCINVAPGTYAHFNDNLTHGGATASSSGYVTYRCTTPAFISGSGCVITDTGDAVRAGMYTTSVAYPNYLVFEGFNFVTTDDSVDDDVAIACAGPGTFGMAQTASLGCHHWWIINNVITGHGQGGVGMNDTEFVYTVHNTVTQNAHMGCVGFYGSGIAYVVAKPVTGYTKTPDDANASNNPSLNRMGVQGPDFPFNDVVAWNSVSNNYQGCATVGGNTDGNGIIIDTFNITKCNTNMVDYPNSTLVAFNVSYNNGGGGVHVFASAHVTVANNSVYYNNTDPTQQPYDRPGIDVNCGSGTSGFGTGTDLYVNNIAYAIPNGAACPGTDNTYLGAQMPFTIGGDGTHLDAVYNTPGHNISYSVGTSCHADSSGNATAAPNPAWSCTTNTCNTDPQWVDVGDSSQGSEQTPPNGSNFALKPGSPAIGAGATAPYLPASSIDIGACASALTICP
jgi:hypothetical protein